jgi:hypothetical protein
MRYIFAACYVYLSHYILYLYSLFLALRFYFFIYYFAFLIGLDINVSLLQQRDVTMLA